MVQKVYYQSANFIMHETKLLYDNSFKVDEKVKQFYTKQRRRIINEYDKNVDEKDNAKRKFVNHLGRQMNKVESAIFAFYHT